jgi:hypothetical protein
MHCIFGRRCEIKGCKNYDKVIAVEFFDGVTKMVCPHCAGKMMSLSMVAPRHKRGVRQF